MLHSLDDRPGVASGTLFLYAGDTRYDVPFADVTATSMNDVAKATPIVIHFATPVPIDHVMVASLDGPGGGPCLAFVGGTTRSFGEKPLFEAFMQRARRMTPVGAPPLVTLTHPNCTDPDHEARLLKGANVPIPSAADRSFAEQRFGPGPVTVDVVVVLDNQARIVSATVPKPGFRPLDDGAVFAALHSTYSAATFRCEGTGGSYRFVVQYGP